jgi:acetyl esterase/lipase
MKLVKLVCLPMIMILGLNSPARAQLVLPLYTDSIPNSKPYPDEESFRYERDSILILSKISRPTLTVFLPPKSKATGAAVIICPGGGYGILASKHEGTDVAKKFNEMGVAAFVVKYRIPNENWMVNKEIGPLQDAQRALQIVRENAKEWNVNKKKIGIMGFSAGGHLASTAGTHFNKAYIDNPKRTSLRPDFMVLIYPVISFDTTIAHSGSSVQLLGKNPPPEKLKEYSNELQVTSKTPPTFLVHAKDDGVKVENSYVFADALRKHGVPVGMHIYEKGGHGYGMYNKTSDVLWMDLVESWLQERKIIRKPKRQKGLISIAHK